MISKQIFRSCLRFVQIDPREQTTPLAFKGWTFESTSLSYICYIRLIFGVLMIFVGSYVYVYAESYPCNLIHWIIWFRFTLLSLKKKESFSKHSRTKWHHLLLCFLPFLVSHATDYPSTATLNYAFTEKEIFKLLSHQKAIITGAKHYLYNEGIHYSA